MTGLGVGIGVLSRDKLKICRLVWQICNLPKLARAILGRVGEIVNLYRFGNFPNQDLKRFVASITIASRDAVKTLESCGQSVSPTCLPIPARKKLDLGIIMASRVAGVCAATQGN